MDEKHTPGPWSVKQHNVGGIFIAADKENICKLDVMGAVHEHKPANAQLIAAAPELLEACEKMLARLTEHANINDALLYSSEGRQMQEAIRKAKGL